MALTPEEVINKRFQATKFKEGYNPEEVDDFLDEIVIELRRLNAENASLKRQVEEAESRVTEAQPTLGQQDIIVDSESDVISAPVETVEAAPAAPVAPAGDSSNAASLLAMAQKVHDDYVAEGQREKERLLNEGREEAQTLLSSAQEERAKVLGDLDVAKAELEGSVEKLRGFEQKYREGLRDYLETQLSDLKTSSTVEKSIEVEEATSLENSAEGVESTNSVQPGWMNQ